MSVPFQFGMHIWEQSFNIAVKKSFCLLNQTAVRNFVFPSAQICVWLRVTSSSHMTSFMTMHTCRSEIKTYTTHRKIQGCDNNNDDHPFAPFLCCIFLPFSRWEDDWWCFSENNWSLTSLQLSSLPLQLIEPLLLAIRLLDRLHTAHNGLCTVEVSSVSLPLAPSLLLALFTRWVWVAWWKVVLMSFWSTFQETTYYSAYECVEFISTHCCGHTKEVKSCYVARLLSSSSVVLPLEFEKN